MRSFMHLVALVWGAGIIIRGLSKGLEPSTAYGWGSVVAFAFGVLLALGALRYFWMRSSDQDTTISGRAWLILLAASGALTAGAMALRPAKPRMDECLAVVHHAQGLFLAEDPSDQARAKFDALRPAFMQACKRAPSAGRKCVLAATTREEMSRCE